MRYQTYNETTLCIWDCDEPIGVIQLIHGAMEHIKRYDHFAKFMNKNNFIVIGSDLPGHGDNFTNSYHNLKNKEEILNQQTTINKYIASKYNLPITILGHSMGSIISRVLILDKNINYENLILSGTFNTPYPKLFLGLTLQKIITSLPNNKDKSSKFVNYLTFGIFDTMSKKKFGSSNWITNDTIIYKAYINDTLCKNPFSNQYVKELLSLVRIATQKNNLNMINNPRTLIISGKEDPVSNFGHEITKLASRLTNVNDVYILDNMKHEVLNEINKDKVYKIILKKISF